VMRLRVFWRILHVGLSFGRVKAEEVTCMKLVNPVELLCDGERSWGERM